MEEKALPKIKELKVKRKRIWELDFLRGICVLLMIWDHLMYDIAFIYGESWAATGKDIFYKIWQGAINYNDSAIRVIFHPIVFITFFVLCGISCSFSRNNLVRGLECLFFAYAITIVTTLMGTPIAFGVLHMLGFSILIWWAINTICKNDSTLTAIVCLAVGIIILVVNQYLKLNPPTPNNSLAFLGEYFVGNNFESADYFPLLPNVGYMLIGSCFGKLLYSKRKSLLPILDKYNWYMPINIWGRIALWVYVLHQVAVIAILSLISYLFIIPGNFVFF